MVISAQYIATEALREIGAYSPYDIAPDPSELIIAIRKINAIVAEKVGTEKLWFFVPSTQTFTLTAEEDEYSFFSLIATPLQFVESMYITDAEGNSREVTLITKERYEDELASGTYRDVSNVPELVYIERNDAPKAYFLPTTDAAYTGRVVGQKYSADLTKEKGIVPTGFPDAWERYLTKMTAFDLGSGSIMKIEESTLNRLKAEFGESEHFLVSRNNREHGETDFVKMRDF